MDTGGVDKIAGNWNAMQFTAVQCASPVDDVSVRAMCAN